MFGGWLGRGATVRRTEDESSEYGRVKRQAGTLIATSLGILLIALANLLMWGPGTMVALMLAAVGYVGVWFLHRGLLVYRSRPELKEEIATWLLGLGIILAAIVALILWRGLWVWKRLWPIGTPHLHAFWKVCISIASAAISFGLYLLGWRMAVEVVDPGHTSRHERVESRAQPYWPWALKPKRAEPQIEIVQMEPDTPVYIDGEEKPALPTPKKGGSQGQAQYFRAVLGRSATLSRKEAMRFGWSRDDWETFVAWVSDNVEEVPKGQPVPESATLKRLMVQVIGKRYPDVPQLEDGNDN